MSLITAAKLPPPFPKKPLNLEAGAIEPHYFCPSGDAAHTFAESHPIWKHDASATNLIAKMGASCSACLVAQLSSSSKTQTHLAKTKVQQNSRCKKTGKCFYFYFIFSASVVQDSTGAF